MQPNEDRTWLSEPDADQFREGDVWESSRGTRYRVIESRRGGKASLRVGEDGSGRLVRRGWSDVIGWVRVKSGEVA